MKIALRACNENSHKLQKMIDECSHLNVVYKIDINPLFWNSDSCVPIISPFKAVELYKMGEIEKVIVSAYVGINTVNSIVCEMKELGFKEEDICIPSVKWIEENSKVNLQSFVQGDFKYQNLNTLYYLEYHIADHCNLNCNGCSHFSPLVPGEKYPTINEIEHEFLQIKKIVEHIEWIRILGGEPFLNRDWKKYVELTRKLWPYSKISIVTNGLQVKTLSEEDVECIKNNDVDLNLSLYPLVWNSIDEIVEFIKEKQMEFTINDGAVFEFSSSFDLDSEDNYVEKRKKCDVQCVNLYRGYIAPCPIMMYVDFFNRYFEKDLPEEKPVKLSEVKDFVTLIELLHRPMEICRYCNQTKQHKWEHITDRSCIKIDKWLA